MEIVWDPPKRETNIRNHRIDFVDVKAGFDFAAALTVASYGGRFASIGMLGDDLVTVVFLPLGTEGISIISARPASRKERRAYAQS